MAGSKANYLELEILDHIFGKGSYTPPTIYVALYTVAPTDSTSGTECTGGSYARKSTAAGDWNTASTGGDDKGIIDNANDITFVEATASWGTVVAFALMDAASGGNMLYWGDLTESKAIGSGDTAKFAAGDLDIKED